MQCHFFFCLLCDLLSNNFIFSSLSLHEVFSTHCPGCHWSFLSSLSSWVIKLCCPNANKVHALLLFAEMVLLGCLQFLFAMFTSLPHAHFLIHLSQAQMNLCHEVCPNLLLAENEKNSCANSPLCTQSQWFSPHISHCQLMMKGAEGQPQISLQKFLSLSFFSSGDHSFIAPL